MSVNPAAVDELRPLLSPQAALITPDKPEFADLTSRWREFRAPSIAAVAQVATEKDVQEVVRIANKFGIPFIARSGGHGATTSLENARNAIQVDFRKLNHVKLSEDGKTATLGGGVTIKQVIDALEAVGERTVMGICESVGLTAPILGGGHGWLQGQYGLPIDQVVSARLVLPNGDLITVSNESHPDLFWAIRGAGHNFGLVTEWEYRVYDAKETPWSWESFIYSQDKLEALYELLNKMMKDQPPEAIHWSYIVKFAEVDPDHPILWFALVYDGPTEAAREYARPFHDIGPMLVQAGEGNLHELAVATFQDVDGLACAYGLTSIRFPVGLKSFDVPAVRKVYDHINETIHKVPELSGAVFLLEGYPTHAVHTVDAASTAFPHRDDKLLVTSYLQYKPDPALDPIAEEFGRTLRDILLEASDDPEHLRAYVNYANGDEPLEAVYGWEPWRLEKLRRLKQQYDPKNVMKYYMPFT